MFIYEYFITASFFLFLCSLGVGVGERLLGFFLLHFPLLCFLNELFGKLAPVCVCLPAFLFARYRRATLYSNFCRTLSYADMIKNTWRGILRLVPGMSATTAGVYGNSKEMGNQG